MKENSMKKIITPSFVIAIIVIILGLTGMYLSFSLAYHDFEFRADEASTVVWNLQNIREMLTGLFWQLQASMLLVIIGISVVIRNLIRNTKKNEEIREELRLLEQEKTTMEELLEKSREVEHIQRLETIGTMTSGIAHEFNNMLTPIMGYSLMSMEMVDQNNTELIENLNEIYEASSKAKKLIRRLSELSRKETGSEFRLLSPDEVLRNTEEMTQVTFPENVELVKEYHCPEKCILGDETQLSQVALNLVINAVQAMQEKGGTLFIRTMKEENSAVIIFEDTGPGIEAEQLGKIFTPFYTTKESGNGTGLGLAIVQHIIHEHNGEITVESEPGKGTKFRIRLPLSE